MPDPLPPIGFWSYTSSDDTASRGDLSQLRRLLADDLQRVIGREPKVHIFQDVAAIPKGTKWEEELHKALDGASFLIPILTPAFLQSEWCCKEILHFEKRTKALGRNDLIFPFHFTDTSHVDPGNRKDVFNSAVLTLLRSHQMLDFRPFELDDPQDRAVGRKLRELSLAIRDALRRPAAAGAEDPARIGAPLTQVASGVPPQTPVMFDAASSGPAASTAPSPRRPAAVAPAPTPPSPPKPPWASASGTDRFGPWADIAVPGTKGQTVTQRLRLIPAGTFQMGSPDDEPGRYHFEGPRHPVTIAEPFWMFDTPCTQALWEAVMGNNPSHFKSATRPVETVSFDDAKKFLTAIDRLIPDLNLSLPSEARWEYACRAGSDDATYAGPIAILGAYNAPVLDAIAWYGGNSGQDFELNNGVDSSRWPEKQYNHTKAGTHPVAKKKPNDFGLYDMLGNVWEWCEDRWHDTYDGAPADGSAWLAGSTARRVIRGGSWYVGARIARAGYRGGSWLDEARLARAGGRFVIVPEVRLSDLGFRCVRGPG